MFRTLCHLTGDNMCVLTHTNQPTVQFMSMHPFSNIHRRFYALYSRIHMELPDFSPTKLV